MTMLITKSVLFLSLYIFVICQAEQSSKISKKEFYKALNKANKTIDDLCEKREKIMKLQGKPKSTPSSRHKIQQLGNARTDKMSADQEIYEETARLLKKKYSAKDIREIASECIRCPGLEVPKCDENYPYRTIDGTCNNLDHPDWGMEPSKFLRLLPADYNDGISELRRSVTGLPLPTPRTISLKIHGHLDVPDPIRSHMTMSFGQFLDHDMSRAPLINNLTCCPNSPEINCGAIIIKRDDPFYSGCNTTCTENTRTQPWLTCLAGPREQSKVSTSYVDGSTVYGSNTNVSKSLRVLGDGVDRGELISSYTEKGGELLQQGNRTIRSRLPFMQFIDENDNRTFFIGGDSRLNQQPALTSIHITFHRLHNKLVKKLRYDNPTWSGEKLYQETRQIVSGIIQSIVYKEYLPAILGPKIMEKFELNVGVNTRYNPKLDATLLNEFSGAAFRFGHSTINGVFVLVHDDGSLDSFELRDNFLFVPLLYDGYYPKIIKGLLVGAQQSFDRFKVKDVTNHLYKARGECYGMDLGALNTFRGRDHGFHPYVDLLEYCGGPRIRSFLDLELYQIFPKGMGKHFANVYKSPRDIDLFTGGMAENKVKGSSVGPTFSCIIGIQFNRLKYGDRFYFEHANLRISLTPEQKNVLRNVTLAQILCMVAEIDKTPLNAFKLESKENPFVPCQALGTFDLNPWNEIPKFYKKI